MNEKAGVTLLHFWGSTRCKKRFAGVIFSELRPQGPGCISPEGVRGQHPRAIFHVVLRLNGTLIVSLNYRIKAIVKPVTFHREKQIIPWLGVYFFTNTVEGGFVRAYGLQICYHCIVHILNSSKKLYFL